MSIIYKVFGKPQTFDEFLDVVKRENATSIDVVVNAYDDISLSSDVTHIVQLWLLAGKRKLKLEEQRLIRTPNLYQVLINKAEVERDYLNKAVEIARNLEGLNFEVSISGKPVYGALKAVEGYDKYIQNLRQKQERKIVNII